MNIFEDTDIPVILGRPFMLTASCIVDMGKRKLELGFEDQKIDFDLFVEDKPAPNGRRSRGSESRNQNIRSPSVVKVSS